jgi:geranylgeranyl diphosphate synthase type I
VLQMMALLHEAHAVMCEGQSLDLQFETATRVDVGAYDRMIECKTARLFEASCRLGALAAGCDAERVAAYGNAGRAYGMAFQIRDDVSGIWSPVNETGKVTGSDVARRKWTFPVVWAISQERSSARTVVADAYALARPLTDAEVERVITALDDLGAKRAADAAAARHVAVIERLAHPALREFLLQTLGLTPA